MRYAFLAVMILGLMFACEVDPEIEDGGGEVPFVYDPTPYDFGDLGRLPPVPTNPDNPTTIKGVELGRHLFYDPILSADSTLACAGCHLQGNAFSDPRRFSVGIDGSEGTRQAMALVNLVYSSSFNWDGIAHNLEDQALEPVINPVEMKNTWSNAVKSLSEHPDYPRMFYEAFETTEITAELTTRAIAQFIKTLISYQSKYDLARQSGSGVFLTEEEFAGEEIFNDERGQCFHCHGGETFNVGSIEGSFTNNGLDFVPEGDFFGFDDLGLGGITGIKEDNGKFKTPTLRNVEFSAPYMHDGRFATLEEVLDFYSEHIQLSPTLNVVAADEFPSGIFLSDEEKAQLLAFLKTLTDTSFLNNERFSSPF